MSLLYLGRIEFPHEFIITGDLLGKDYISIALEDGLVERIKNYREKHNIKLTKTGPLGKKFKILAEYGINIPVSDYESQIVDFRNNVVHHANKVSDYDARRFWKDCQLIMREYGYPMISD